jgi:hypothetical protein
MGNLTQWQRDTLENLQNRSPLILIYGVRIFIIISNKNIPTHRHHLLMRIINTTNLIGDLNLRWVNIFLIKRLGMNY